jgi:two-component system chemotaxis response regulator CheB
MINLSLWIYHIACSLGELNLGERKIRLLVVDETKFMRKALKDIFSKDNDFEVVCTAKDGKDALEKISECQPDVITMDIDMPTMDGLTALKHIMMKSPVPIVMVSALTDNPEVNFEIWRLGSIEFVKKPSGSVSSDVDKQKEELIRKVKRAYFANLQNVKRVRLSQRSMKRLIRSGESAKQINLILGGAGSLNNIIYLLNRYNAGKNNSLLILLDFNLHTLSIFQKRANDISLIETYLADKSMTIMESCAIIAPISRIKNIHWNNNSYFLDIAAEDDVENLDRLFGILPDKLYQDSSLFVLNSEKTGFIDALSSWAEKGGKIYYQDPSTCIFPQLVNFAISENIQGEIITLNQYIEKLNNGSGTNA